MGKFIDLTGQKFGRLTVVSRSANKGNLSMWNCTCDCGCEVVVCGAELKRGRTRSCGCVRREIAQKSMFKHHEETYGKEHLRSFYKSECIVLNYKDEPRISTDCDNRIYTVYKHTCPNNKVYIGITCSDVHERWRQNGKGYKNQYFYRAITKYGWENIKHEILYSGLTKSEAETKEFEIIALCKSNLPEYGYNIDNGGKTGGRMSEATKEKLRIINLQKHQKKKLQNTP